MFEHTFYSKKFEFAIASEPFVFRSEMLLLTCEHLLFYVGMFLFRKHILILLPVLNSVMNISFLQRATCLLVQTHVIYAMIC
uniref:Putative ovule protein n=1 Tax=Solanum chacoense TaxID=4108 RepID=A0A0V0I173_SOLCH